jgi:hypothetical protein
MKITTVLQMKVLSNSPKNNAMYKNDPREIKVKYPCYCAACGIKLPKGVNVYYWPTSKKIFCRSCGDADFKAFLESAWDEEQYQMQYH